MKNLLLAAFISTAAMVSQAQTKVTFYTSMGNFDVEMYDSLMPITAGNFIKLVDSNFYDGVIFHRIIRNFVIQGGDPTGTGTGGPGYTIPDEFDSTGILSNRVRTLSMANSGPNSGGSQFFINLKNNTYLDYDKAPLTSAHPVFGIARDGWHIVDSIGKVAVNPNDRPTTPVVMDSIRVTGRYVSIAELPAQKVKISVSPNPFKSEINLTDIELHEVKTVCIYSIDGVLLKETSNPSSTVTDISDITSGTYILRVLYKDGRQGMTKVVKAD